MSDDRLILCCEFTANDGKNFFFVPDEETFDALVLLSELGADEASEFGGFDFDLKYDGANGDIPVITLDNIKTAVADERIYDDENDDDDEAIAEKYDMAFRTLMREVSDVDLLLEFNGPDDGEEYDYEAFRRR